MDSEKFTDCTEEEIQSYLDKLKDAIDNKRITIAVDRDKNNKFIDDYGLTEKKRNKMLGELTIYDFCYTTMNVNLNYPEVLLYVFTKEYKLDNYSESKNVIVYVKFYIILKRCQEYGVMVSFHETDQHEKHLFIED